MGRWSNLSDQGERLETLAKMVPSGAIQTNSPKSRTKKQVHKRLLPSQVDELVAAYEKGAKLTDLVAKFGINRGTASGLLESRGVARRYRKLSPADIQRMIDLYQSGLSLISVADLLEVNPTTVRHHLLRGRVHTRDSHGRER